MRYVYLTLIVVFVVLLLIFAFSNMGPATVSFLGWQVTGPLALMILAVYALGMISGGSVLSFLRHSLHKATEKRAPKAAKAPPPSA